MPLGCLGIYILANFLVMGCISNFVAHKRFSNNLTHFCKIIYLLEFGHATAIFRSRPGDLRCLHTTAVFVSALQRKSFRIQTKSAGNKVCLGTAAAVWPVNLVVWGYVSCRNPCDVCHLIRLTKLCSIELLNIMARDLMNWRYGSLGTGSGVNVGRYLRWYNGFISGRQNQRFKAGSCNWNCRSSKRRK